MLVYKYVEKRTAGKGSKKKAVAIDWANDVILFSIGELGLTVADTYNLTWAEYCLLSYGYRRRAEEKLKDIRLLSYANFLAHWTSKAKPPTIEKYWNLENKKDTDEAVNAKKEKFLEISKRFYQGKK